MLKMKININIRNIITTFIAPFKGLTPEIWLLAAVNMVNRVGSMVLAFLTIYLTKELHFSLIDAGYIMSFFGIGTIFGAYFGGLWTDRFGYHRVQLCMLIAGGISMLLAMLMKDFWSLCAILFCISFAADAFRPANSIAIKTHSTDEQRTRSFSLLRVGVNLSIAVAVILGGLLTRIGWSYLFWADALTSFAAALTLIFFVKEKKRTQVVDKQEVRAEIKAAKSAFKDKDYLVFVLMTFLGAMVFMQLIWSVPKFFKDIYGWEEVFIGFMVAINGVTVMLAEMPVVFQLDGKRHNLYFVRIGIVIYAACYVAFLLPVSVAFYSVIFYMIAISFGEIFVMPFSSSWATKRGDGPRQGEYMGLYGQAYSFSNVLAPIFATQIIYRFGYDALWYALVLLCVFAWFGFRYLEKNTD